MHVSVESCFESLPGKKRTTFRQTNTPLACLAGRWPIRIHLFGLMEHAHVATSPFATSCEEWTTESIECNQEECWASSSKANQRGDGLYREFFEEGMCAFLSTNLFYCFLLNGNSYPRRKFLAVSKSSAPMWSIASTRSSPYE